MSCVSRGSWSSRETAEHFASKAKRLFREIIETIIRVKSDVQLFLEFILSPSLSLRVLSKCREVCQCVSNVSSCVSQLENRVTSLCCRVGEFVFPKRGRISSLWIYYLWFSRLIFGTPLLSFVRCVRYPSARDSFSRGQFHAESPTLTRTTRFYVESQLWLQHPQPTDGEPGQHKIRGSNDPASEHELE